jgi:hypothetical protein
VFSQKAVAKTLISPICPVSNMQTLPFAPGPEPLESRIAPAGTAFHASDYTDPGFVDTTLGGDEISAVVGPGGFYFKLGTGDSLLINTPVGFQNLVAAARGNVVAFFVDDGDGDVESHELRGLSLGNGASVAVSGNVNGDVVSNYNDVAGKLGGTGEVFGFATDLLNNVITSLSISGDVSGKIISGASISRISAGTITDVFTGTAANGQTYDLFGGVTVDGGDTLQVGAPAAGTAGPSVANVTVAGLTQIVTGDGGDGLGGRRPRVGSGGSILNVVVSNDLNGLLLETGDGGDGIGGARPIVGSGGTISDVVIFGPDSQSAGDTSANSLIEFRTGDGGIGTGAGRGVLGKSGAGGLVRNVFVGFDSKNLNDPSVNLLQDNVSIETGVGGGGRKSGNGGLISNVHILTATPNAVGDEYSIIAGDAGAADNGGIGGVGGGVNLISLRNVLPLGDGSLLTSSANATMLLQSGDGGTPGGNTGVGGSGGGILNATLEGYNFSILTGQGIDGTAGGGSGGLISSLRILGADLHAKTVGIHTGNGGNSSAGRGGFGGGITGLTINTADFTDAGGNPALDITTGSGGNSARFNGGNGGALFGALITDIDFTDGLNPVVGMGTVSIITGDGGFGPIKGGFGGGIVSTTIEGTNLHFGTLVDPIQTGDGGDSTSYSPRNVGRNRNAPGAGGSFAKDAFISIDTTGNAFDAHLATGEGGDGTLRVAGAAGGGMNVLNVRTNGTVLLETGQGGNGGTSGAAGTGGGISGTSAFSLESSVELNTGDAGTAGARGGNGGAVVNTAVRAFTDITLTTGDGMLGGAGGGIVDASFGGVLAFSAPTGNVDIHAGDGSGNGAFAGAGGGILRLTGVVSSGNGTTTSVVAGNGGAGDTVAAAGGSVTDLRIHGGGGANVTFFVEAGNATAANNARFGGAGGNVNGVAVAALDSGTIFHHVAAGDGGDTNLATGRGGLGGSVSSTFVNADIGVRSGRHFGFNAATEMGGIFAGIGGQGGGVDGLAGNVISVTADAIASIVAGRITGGGALNAVNLVTKVDGIILNGANKATVAASGTASNYTNFDTANLVGGVATAAPNADPNANVFKTDTDIIPPSSFAFGDSPQDGLIAAVTLTAKKNFVPEAFVTKDANGNAVLVDSLNV